MSLATRFLLVLLALAVAVLGLVQLANWWTQRRWLEQVDADNQRLFSQVLADAYAEGDQSRAQLAARIRRLFELREMRLLFRDALITSGNAPYPGSVELNPLGALGRDRNSFPREEVLAGLRRAQAGREVVPAAGGYCVPLRVGERAAGALWYLPTLPGLPPAPPLQTLILPVLLGLLPFGWLAWVALRRTVVLPLRGLGDAADRVGGGEFGVRAQVPQGARELTGVVTVFNAMAQQVENHTTELRQAVEEAEDRVRRQERALVVSSRLAAVGTLAAGIAHEINNPIGGMQNAVQRLLAADNLEERQRVYLELVQDGLSRVGQTVRKVLDFSPRSTVSGPVEVAAAVQGARDLVEHRLVQDGVTLTVEIPRELPEVQADRGELTQVFLNLLINALDAFGEAGPGIDSGAQPVAQPAPGPGGRQVVIRAWAPATAAGRVRVEVADNGPGCPPDKLPRVLDAFYSGKQRPDASGLGLAISFAILQSHGGSLEVDAAPGGGFRVTLELAPVEDPGSGPLAQSPG